MRPDPRELRALWRRDPALGRAARRLPPLPDFPLRGVGGHKSHFEALARMIVYQQLAGAAAATIWGRVCALAEGERSPSAATLLQLSDAALRGAGLSAGKLAALRDLAARCEDGRLRLRSIGRFPDEEVTERLVEVRGIGPWSAQMFLLFRLGRPDVLAPGDLGVQEGLRLLDGLEARPDARAVEARAECWRPLRSVGTWLMYRLVDERRAADAGR